MNAQPHLLPKGGSLGDINVESTPPTKGPTKSSRRNVTSIACLACREKKVKCDGKRPSCKQCLRKDIYCTYPSDGDYQKRYTRLASYQCFLDTLRNGSEADAEAILRCLRQPVSPLEDQSIDDRLKTIEAILQRLREVPQNEAADLVKRMRTGETAEQTEYRKLPMLGQEHAPVMVGKPVSGQVGDPNDVLPPTGTGNIAGRELISSYLDARSLELSGPTLAEGILYSWSRMSVSDTRKIGIAIDAFFKSSGKLFLMFNEETIMQYHSNIYFDRPDIPQQVKQAQLCCLCAIAAVGTRHAKKSEYNTAYSETLYCTAINHFALLSKVLPLDAIKVCTLLAHYNIERGRTTALAFVEIGFSLYRAHDLHDRNIREPGMAEDTWLNLRKTWRTLIFQSSFLSSTLGYISGSGISFEGLPLSEVQLGTAPLLQITVSKELTKLCLLNASIARMDFTLKEQTARSTASLMKDLQDWYSQIPEELHVAALIKNQDQEDRVAIYYINLMYLSAMVLLYRHTAAWFLRSFGLVTRGASSQGGDFDDFVFGNAKEGILAARESARMFELILLEDVAIWKCWLVIFQAYTTCTVILQSAIQKQIHLTSSAAWEQDLHHARSCLTILERCGSVDSIAGKMHSHLASIYDSIAGFDSSPLAVTPPILPVNYALTIPEGSRSAMPECIRMSTTLLTRLCGPFNGSDEDEAQKRNFESPWSNAILPSNAL